jgi:hypothetical protein
MYDKTKIREFFAEFWKNPENVKRFKEERAKSTIGKVDKFGRRYTTQEDFDAQCEELGLPVLRFRVS